MRRFILVLILLIGLAGCKTVPGPGWHNPDKPVAAYDYDFYNCRMIALQTTPQQTAPAANALYSQCYMVGNMQQCWQQQAPIYRDQAPTPDPEWAGKIDAMTNECLARQGWTRIPAAETRSTGQ